MWSRTLSYARKTQLIVLLLVASCGIARAAEPDVLWAAVRDGSVFVMMRHVLAPGTGDPDGFDVNECATQRNLSDDGRQQAKEIGEQFRQNGVPQAAVFSSAWCRCLETARLLDIGPVEVLAPLNSFFGNWDRRDAQTAALKSWLASQKADKPFVLVTHQVNITALTGVYPRSGDMVVVRREPDGAFTVLGKL